MTTKAAVIDRLSYIECNIEYYNQRIKEAKKIRLRKAFPFPPQAYRR